MVVTVETEAEGVDDFDDDAVEAEIAALSLKIDSCHKQREQIDKQIADILVANAQLPKLMNVSLNRMKTQTALVESDASQLSSMLSLTSVLAENISGKVKELDIAKSRVVECLQRVEDILDLRFCTEGVAAAMANEDYEQAANLIHRFLALDQEFLMGQEMAQEPSSPTGATPLPSTSSSPPSSPTAAAPPSNAGDGRTRSTSESGGTVTVQESIALLQKARDELRKILRDRFDEAVASKDVASMERFFKLFPLVKEHEDGLKRFANYLRKQMVEAADRNFQVMQAGGETDHRSNVLFADTLTLLFEGIARIVEIHQPLVDRYYGQGRMVVFMGPLQEECDRQAVRILDQFVARRGFNVKAREVEAYLRASATTRLTLSKPEPLDIDLLLSEVTLMHTRADMYLNFVRRRLSPKPKTGDDGQPKERSGEEEKRREVERFLSSCRLNTAMQDLIGKYIGMEEYFMRECISKLLEQEYDHRETVPEKPTLGYVDDVFYLIRKCVRRSLTSSNIDVVCAVLNYACDALETTFFNALHTKLRAGYPGVGSLAEAYTTAAAAYTSVVQQGKMPPAATDSASKARLAFVAALNDVTASITASRRLEDSAREDAKGTWDLEDDGVMAGKLDNAVSNIADLTAKFRQAQSYGLSTLVSSGVKPRVKSWTEAFTAYTHTPTDDEFADFEANDPFISAYLSGIDSLFVEWREMLLPELYEPLVEGVAAEAASRLEKVALKCNYNRLGGLQFDKELRDLIGYLTAVSSWSVREKFGRLIQIAALLSCDSPSELEGTISGPWLLTQQEARSVLALRTDLASDGVRAFTLK